MELDPEGYKNILCSLCKVNSVFKRGTRNQNGIWIHTRYNWVCSVCKQYDRIAPQTNDETTEHLLHLPFNEEADLNSSSIVVPDNVEDGYAYEDLLPKGRKIVHLNINGIKSKFEEVRHFLTNEKNVMCLALTESKLSRDRDFKICLTFQVTTYYVTIV